MKPYARNTSFLKILFIVVSVFAFSNKLSANTVKTTTDFCATSFSTDNLNDKDVEVSVAINIDLCEEEEKFSNAFFITFQNKENITKRDVSAATHFKVHLSSLAKKRFYILYCQLKTHL